MEGRRIRAAALHHLLYFRAHPDRQIRRHGAPSVMCRCPVLDMIMRSRPDDHAAALLTALNLIMSACDAPFERQSIANFSHNALLQWLLKWMRVSRRVTWSLQVQFAQFPRPAERLAIRHDFGHDSLAVAVD